MIRTINIIRSLTRVALWLALVPASCGGDAAAPQTIAMRAALTFPADSNIGSVTYLVTSRSGATLEMGTISVSSTNAALSLNMMLPPGTGDILELTATTGSGGSCTGKSVPFDVIAGGATSVNLTLICGDSQPTACPEIQSWMVTPDEAEVPDGMISASVTVAEADATEPLSYSWKATGGVFNDASAASTIYTCTSLGPQSITLTVTEGTPPSACSTTAVFQVGCGVSPDAGVSPF